MERNVVVGQELDPAFSMSLWGPGQINTLQVQDPELHEKVLNAETVPATDRTAEKEGPLSGTKLPKFSTLCPCFVAFRAFLRISMAKTSLEQIRYH